jgi:hypothetical protein
MLASIKKYSPEGVEFIHRMLLNHVQSGRKPQFEIFVDNLPIVPRTDNIDLFQAYGNHIGSDSRELKIIVYQGKSNHNDKYIFRLGDDPVNNLAGTDNSMQSLDGIINQRLMEAEQRWEHQRTAEKVDGLQKEMQDQEKYIEVLEGKIKKYEDEEKGILFAGVLGNFGGRVVDAAIQNSNKLQSLLGLGNIEKPASASLPESDTMTFKARESDDPYYKLANQVRQDFTPEEFKTLSQLIYYFSKQKDDLVSMHQMVYPKAVTSD